MAGMKASDCPLGLTTIAHLFDHLVDRVRLHLSGDLPVIIPCYPLDRANDVCEHNMIVM